MDSAEGRFQTIRSTDGITAIVDYAHTPDALKNVLSTINKIRSGNEKLITVVGCGEIGMRQNGQKWQQLLLI